MNGDPESDAAALASQVHAELVRRSAMLATAESLTGGALGEMLSAAPGASATYLGGVVCYATQVKRTVLGVTDETIEQHGVVSAECAGEMATGVRSLLAAEYAVSTTGVAGPDSQEQKPVGTVYVAVAGPRGVTTRHLRVDGDRPRVRHQACVAALSSVLQVLHPVTG